MNLELTPEERAFRDELREVFLTEVPADVRRRATFGEATKDDIVTTQRILNKHGLATPRWPVAWGGKDWTETQRHIYEMELQRAGIPPVLPFNVGMVGPVIAEFGSEEQKQKFLPATANLDIWWSQGFSEPEAGSDLAGLKTTAVRDGDHYVVNGQKTWTTLGQHGDWMFVLARTNPGAEKKQQGISFLLVDMTTPGIERRPIRLVDGSVEVNEFFFTDVEVPVENLVGEENKGWDYAKFLLGNERSGIASVGVSQRVFGEIAKLADRPLGTGTVADDPQLRTRMHALKLRLLALEATQLRVTAASEGGKPNAASSLLKLEGTRIRQELAAIRCELLGPDAALIADEDPAGAADAGNPVAQYLNNRKLSIFGGSNEIQRGVIAKTILGL